MTNNHTDHGNIITRQLQQASHRHNARCHLCTLFPLCDASAPQALQQHLKHYRKNTVIYQRHSPFTHIYCLRQGAIKTSMMTRDGQEQVMGFYFAGDIIGTDGLAHGKHTVHARALQDTAICRIPIELILQQPDRAQFLFTLISREIVHGQHHLAMINRTQAQTRLATLLLDIAGRQAETDTSLYMPIPRTDIANYLGLTIETVSRTLRSLEHQGIIRRNRKWIQIEDLPALQKLSYF